MIIGITGGTGCGKTTLLRAIEARFPGVVEDGQLQRKKLGNIVFSDENALSDLNKITHSAIRREVQRQLSAAPGLAAIDAIALFESGLSDLCQVTVAVTAPVEDRIARLMQRDGISREYAGKRIAAQRSNEEFSAFCSHTLENNGEICAFRAKCLAFLAEFGIM